MTDFTLHDVLTAPAASRPILHRVEEQYGMVPNLFGMLAASPAALESYLSLGESFSKTSLTPTEKTVVRLTVIRANGCAYSMAAYTGIAVSERVDLAIIDMLRAGTPPPDERLAALQRFTRLVVEERGKIGDPELKAFLAAGFSKSNAFDVLVGVAQEVLANYANLLARTPVDSPFRRFAWDSADYPPTP